MELHDVVSMLTAIIDIERKNGCPMASEALIRPAVRRWSSYARRNRRNKNQTMEHRIIDLKKGLLILFPNYNYDESCLTHLAQSFAAVLSQEAGDCAANPHHLPGTTA
jgi:hypothetical protein